MATDIRTAQQYSGPTRRGMVTPDSRTGAPTTTRSPAAAPKAPSPTISEEAARRDKTDNDEFERQAAVYLRPTGARPALVSGEEVDKMRTGYTTGAGRLDVLTKTRNYREAYWQSQQGLDPFDALTPDQTARAQKFFEQHGVRLADEPKVAPPNPIRAKAEADKAAERAEVAPAQAAPEPIAALPADIGGAVRGAVPVPPAATLEIEFTDPQGYHDRLVIYPSSTLEQIAALMGLGAKVRVKLAEAGAKPIPAAVAAGQGGAKGSADGTPPKCKYHGAMKRSDKFAGWYCPKKLAEGGYCDQKVMDEP